MLRAVKVRERERKKKTLAEDFPAGCLALTLVQIQMPNSRDGAWHPVGPPRLSAFIIVLSSISIRSLSQTFGSLFPFLVPDDLMLRDMDGEIGDPWEFRLSDYLPKRGSRQRPVLHLSRVLKESQTTNCFLLLWPGSVPCDFCMESIRSQIQAGLVSRQSQAGPRVLAAYTHNNIALKNISRQSANIGKL